MSRFIICSQSAELKVAFESRVDCLEGVERYVGSEINNGTKDMHAFNSKSRITFY